MDRNDHFQWSYYEISSFKRTWYKLLDMGQRRVYFVFEKVCGDTRSTCRLQDETHVGSIQLRQTIHQTTYAAFWIRQIGKRSSRLIYAWWKHTNSSNIQTKPSLKIGLFTWSSFVATYVDRRNLWSDSFTNSYDWLWCWFPRCVLQGHSRIQHQLCAWLVHW